MIQPHDLIVALGFGVMTGWMLKTTVICWRAYRQERERRRQHAEWRRWGGGFRG